MSRRDQRGQVAILTVIIVAYFLLQAAALYYRPSPVVVRFDGYIQSAELIHAARLYWANHSNGGTLGLGRILSVLYSYNDSCRLYLPLVTFVNDEKLVLGGSGYGYYKTRYSNSVCFVAEWKWQFRGTYIKVVGDRQYVYRNYTLYYAHRYYIPQLAGNFTLYPRLWDPAGAASLNETSPGLWVVGFPAGNSTYSLVDEFGIRIEVGG